MKLTSLLGGVDVVLREFDWSDNSHIAQSNEWRLQYGITFEQLSMGSDSIDFEKWCFQ
jgi:hypothetical protein